MITERNWAGNLTYRARSVVHPSSQDEVAVALRGAGPVRALGTRHGFSDIADTEGTLIALDQMPVEIEIAAERDAVRVAGGIRYGDLAPELERHGLALANLASLPHISVAGAIATGTHGSGDGTGSLASAVRALTIMTATGEVRQIRRGDPGFDGAVVSLGALGIVLEVTLDVEPSYTVAQHVYEHPQWDVILADLGAVTGVGTSVSIFSSWQNTAHADQIWVKQRQPDDRADHRAELAHRLGAAIAEQQRHPILGASAEACTAQQGVAGAWFERLPHFRLDFTPSAGAEIQSEYLVPRADAVEAIEAIRSLADQIAPLLFVNEIRTVRADSLWLSSSYGVDAVGLHFTWKPDEPAVRSLLPVLEAALPNSTRPHWGKVFTLAGQDVSARYPRWADFAALRTEFDPERRFVNDYLRRLGL